MRAASGRRRQEFASSLFSPQCNSTPGDWGASTCLVLGRRGAEQMHKLFRKMCVAGGDKVIVRTRPHAKNNNLSESAFKVIYVPTRHLAKALHNGVWVYPLKGVC